MIPAHADLPAAEAIASALVHHVEASCDVSRVEVDGIGVHTAMLPEDPAAWSWHGNPCHAHPTLRLRGEVDGRMALDITVRPELTLWSEQPVLTAAVTQGDAITVKLVESAFRATAPEPAQNGWLARRDLSAGESVNIHDARPPTSVLRGDEVVLVVSRGPITLKAPGSALHDARVGEALSVLNEATGTRNDGVLLAGRRVEIR